MGHKVHPIGFRLGVIRDWQAKWYADKHYAEFLQEDLKIRQTLDERYADAAVSTVEIERQSNQVTINIYTARPGIVIGRGGQRVDETRRQLEKLLGKRAQLNIQEVQQPELDARLVAKTIAEQIERRIAYRRAMRQALIRSMQAGAKGIKISCAGRLGGAEIARRLNMHDGQVPLHTLRADVDYGFVEARTVMGRIGVKVWIYKGEILPEAEVEEIEEEEVVQPAAAEATEVSAEAEPAVEPSEEQVVEEPVAEQPAEVSAEAGPAEKEPEPAPEASIEEEAPAEVKVEAEPETSAEVEAPAETPVEPEAEPASEESIETEAPAEAEDESKPEASAETEAPAEVEDEPVPEASAEAEIAEAEGEPESETSAEADAPAETPVEPEAEPASEESIETEAPAEAEDKSAPEANIEEETPEEAEDKPASVEVEAEAGTEVEATEQPEGEEGATT
jgi:small subunit ribosomal protein S3